MNEEPIEFRETEGFVIAKNIGSGTRNFKLIVKK
jgi:hypothetical protein